MIISKGQLTDKQLEQLREDWDLSSMYPSVMAEIKETITRIEVKNVSMNSKGKVNETLVQVESLLDATRFINGFKPKRGYQHVSWDIKEVEVLW
jgi:hypothetical protein